MKMKQSFEKTKDPRSNFNLAIQSTLTLLPLRDSVLAQNCSILTHCRYQIDK